MNNKEKFLALKKMYDLKAEYHKLNVMKVARLSDEKVQELSKIEELISTGKSIYSLFHTFRSANG